MTVVIQNKTTRFIKLVYIEDIADCIGKILETLTVSKVYYSSSCTKLQNRLTSVKDKHDLLAFG